MTWWLKAACRGMDPDLFYSERADGASDRAAKAVCARCPVVDECLDFGLYEKFGIWGGTTEKKRRVIRRQRSRRGAA